MDFSNRKPNRLSDYDYSRNGAYFITVCTKDSKCVLSQIVGKRLVGADIIRPQVQLKPYGIIVDDAINQIERHYECVFVDNYVIMPNHIHLLLRIDNYGRMVSAPTISTVVGSLKRYVSQKTTPIWQKGFHDHVIRDEEDYLTRWQYIDENPKKWLIGKDEYYSL